MRKSKSIVLVALAVTLSSCSAPIASYSQVRAETLEVLQTVADRVPEAVEILPTPEFEPYSCNDGLALQKGQGAFFTGQWAIFVQEDFDVPRFVESVPELLGETWHVEELGIPVDFAEVYLVRDSPRMSLKVEEATIDGRRAIDLLAISRCGRISDQERTATFPPPTPQPAP